MRILYFADQLDKKILSCLINSPQPNKSINMKRLLKIHQIILIVNF